jgi:hypothetical protein
MLAGTKVLSGVSQSIDHRAAVFIGKFQNAPTPRGDLDVVVHVAASTDQLASISPLAESCHADTGDVRRSLPTRFP